MSDFIDATQSYSTENESGGNTTITNISNTDLLTPPTTSDANSLIKLVVNPATNTTNLYILQANTNGEIRFLTKEAYLNNDVSVNDGNLFYNVKIGADGKLYCYYTYDFLNNPLRTSGWYDVMDDISGLAFQITGLEVSSAGFTASLVVIGADLLALQEQTSINTSGVSSLALRVSKLEAYVDIGSVSLNQSTQVDIDDALITLSDGIAQFEAVGSIPAQSTRLIATTRYGILTQQVADNAIGAIGAIGFIAATVAGIRAILDNQKKTEYQAELLGLGDTVSKIAVSTTLDRLVHTGISISSGNTGFATTAVYRITIQREAVLIINVSASLGATILNVEQYGVSTFSIGETITITKAQLGGGTGGNLVMNVVALGTLKTWAELRTTYLQDKINGVDTKQRRKQGVLGADDIDTTQFTTTNVSYTNTTEPTAETITYKQLKSRLNLLPTGTSDIDVYTNTGKIGIGTTPTKTLHTYHATDNILRLGTATNGTASIEFVKGTDLDVNSDWRLKLENVMKLQYQNSTLAFGDTGTDLMWNSTTQTTFFKPIEAQSRVGIGTAAPTTHFLDVFGDVNIKSGAKYKINGTDLSYNNLTDKLVAGTNIAIDAATNTISASGGGTTYTAGDGIAISGANAISLGGTFNNFYMYPTLQTALLPADLVFTGTQPVVFSLPAPFNTLNKCVILEWNGTGTSTNYSFVIPTGGLIIDFLMVGSGGCGGKDMGAGGGGGATMFGTNIFIPAGSYSANVGRGAQSSLNETKGRDTSCFNAGCAGGGSAPNVAYNGYSYSNQGGGGAGGTSVANGNNYSAVGGLGGIDSVFGGSYRGNTLTKCSLNQGLPGGTGVNTRAGGGTGQICSAGGGTGNNYGVNGASTTAIGTGTAPSNGGTGLLNDILGTAYRWGGGGGGGSTGYLNASTGGLGGGGGGQNANGAGATSFGAVGGSTYYTGGTGATALNGVNGTGGGGGGVGLGTTLAGNGGSGIVIIRYRRPKNAQIYIENAIGATPVLRTFRTGMVDGNFKIQSVVASTGVATDVISVEEATGDLSIGNYTGGIAVSASGVAYFKNDITAAGIVVKNGSISCDNNINLQGAYGYGNLRLTGLISNNIENNAVWTTNALSPTGTWMIRLASMPTNWYLNIHNLVVWDTGNVSGLSSVYFGVWGFTNTFPYEGLLLSSNNKVNNGQTIAVSYGVVSSVGYFVITGIPITTQVFWRLT